MRGVRGTTILSFPPLDRLITRGAGGESGLLGGVLAPTPHLAPSRWAKY